MCAFAASEATQKEKRHAVKFHRPFFLHVTVMPERKKGVVVALLTIESSDDCDVDAVVTSLFALLLPSFPF
jgi:hypothetical protein